VGWKRQFRRHLHRLDDNIKIYLKEVNCMYILNSDSLLVFSNYSIVLSLLTYKVCDIVLFPHPSHLNLLTLWCFFTTMIFGEEYEQQSSSLCNFFYHITTCFMVIYYILMVSQYCHDSFTCMYLKVISFGHFYDSFIRRNQLLYS
jgi:hypothetical protein